MIGWCLKRAGLLLQADMPFLYVKEHSIGPVTYFIDSAYVVNAFKENWLNNWISNGWRNSKKEEVKNKDLWLELIEALEEEFYQIEKIKGHQKNGNYNDYRVVHRKVKVII